jgi:hypothetical protein
LTWRFPDHLFKFTIPKLIHFRHQFSTSLVLPGFPSIPANFELKNRQYDIGTQLQQAAQLASSAFSRFTVYFYSNSAAEALQHSCGPLLNS